LLVTVLGSLEEAQPLLTTPTGNGDELQVEVPTIINDPFHGLEHLLCPSPLLFLSPPQPAHPRFTRENRRRSLNEGVRRAAQL